MIVIHFVMHHPDVGVERQGILLEAKRYFTSSVSATRLTPASALDGVKVQPLRNSLPRLMRGDCTDATTKSSSMTTKSVPSPSHSS